MKTLIVLHFHPVYRYAQRFVEPLLGTMFSGDVRVVSKCICCDDVENNLLFLSAMFSPKRSLSIRSLLSGVRNIISILRVERPQVVVCHNSVDSLVPLLISFVMRTKIRVYFNHGFPGDGYSWHIRWPVIWIERFCCLLSTEVITVSPYLVGRFRSLGVANVRVIDQGSACGIIKDSVYAVRRKRLQQMGSATFRLGYVGRPVRRKGFSTLRSAWSKFVGNDSSVSLALAGIGWSEVDGSWISLPGVVFKGFLCPEEMKDFYSQVDVVVLPSFHEGLSYTVLEAMNHGCIVIGRDVPGINCLIDHGQNGFLVPAGGGSDAFCEAFREARNIFISEGWRSLQEAGFQTVSSFDRARFLKAYRFWLWSLID